MEHDPPLNYSGKLWRLGRICRDKRLSQAAIAVAAVLIEHADRYSGRCYPSVSRIVTESGLPRTNVLRALKALESTGWIIVERRTGATSHYVLTGATGDTSATHGTGTTHGSDESQTGTTHGTEPVPRMAPKQKRKAKATEGTRKRALAFATFDEWIDGMPDHSEPIAADHPIFRWAEQVGIPDDWLYLAWLAFQDRYRGDKTKRYRDWSRVYQNAVQGDWLKLWRFDPASGGYLLTTAGEQWKRFEQSQAA